MGTATVPRQLDTFLPGALIGMIQPASGSPTYFPIGEAAGVKMPASGTLSLLVNDLNPQNNSGSFWVEFTLCAKVDWNCETTSTFSTLIVNGSFENGPPAGSYLNLLGGATAVIGWEVTGQGIDYVGTLWRASAGSRSIELDGSAPSRLTPPYAIGGIKQTFPTTANRKYEVSFDLAGNGFQGPPVKRLRLSAAGQSADFEFTTRGNSPTNMGWTRKTWTFIATGTLTTIEFRSLNPSGATGYGAAIDAVIVREVDPTALQELHASFRELQAGGN
jgi:choice-of-anchor C domain-containing protein